MRLIKRESLWIEVKRKRLLISLCNSTKYNNINNLELEEENKQDLSGSFVQLQQSSICSRKHSKRLRREMEEME